ncbi:hypothetical protein [Boudabousia marimammalium]|uniref:Uncharacterized protein n=1 Tax=Boudabousia marimammalium TaxID=156892 RepID=A0A1Q5PQW6_9ACTO|nr:hypothetical protein [Boudabousia marimammalium]OKL49926.1 hypothetical protein BM477_03205 [Boudabousia marimammalium]
MEVTSRKSNQKGTLPLDLPATRVEAQIEAAEQRYRRRFESPELESGWTVESGIFDLIEPCISPDQLKDFLQFSRLVQSESEVEQAGDNSPPDFARFKNLTAETVLELIERLPGRALADRQNEAPLLLDFLRACLKNPDDVSLFGYYVGPQRGDERISVEGMLYHRHSDLEIKRFHDESCSCDELWDYIVEECDWSEAIISTPDELTEVSSEHPQGVGWRLWWD